MTLARFYIKAFMKFGEHYWTSDSGVNILVYVNKAAQDSVMANYIVFASQLATKLAVLEEKKCIPRKLTVTEISSCFKDEIT